MEIWLVHVLQYVAIKFTFYCRKTNIFYCFHVACQLYLFLSVFSSNKTINTTIGAACAAGLSHERLMAEGWVATSQDQPRPPKTCFSWRSPLPSLKLVSKILTTKWLQTKTVPMLGAHDDVLPCVWADQLRKLFSFLLNSFFLLRFCVFSFEREIISISMITKTALAGDRRRCRRAKCIRSSMVKLQCDDLNSVDRRILSSSSHRGTLFCVKWFFVAPGNK